jgi:hypothetical protein
VGIEAVIPRPTLRYLMVQLSNWRHRIWQPAVERAGLPPGATPNVLRHGSQSHGPEGLSRVYCGCRPRPRSDHLSPHLRPPPSGRPPLGGRSHGRGADGGPQGEDGGCCRNRADPEDMRPRWSLWVVPLKIAPQNRAGIARGRDSRRSGAGISPTPDLHRRGRAAGIRTRDLLTPSPGRSVSRRPHWEITAGQRPKFVSRCKRPGAIGNPVGGQLGGHRGVRRAGAFVAGALAGIGLGND